MNTMHRVESAVESGTFLGECPRTQEIKQQLQEVAPTDLTVLLLGETGTGKGVAARLLHQESLRRGGPLVAVNCGALPSNLVDSELFGHERGAFTGAVAQKKGKCELANGGTLFLDEIADLSLESQTRLLRVLQERVFERVGGTHTLSLDVRVIAATHQHLKQAVHQGRFRQDLYYRLHVFPVRLPPLRERLDDLPLLAAHFVGQELSPEALALLQSYDWPGNVRELEHTLQRAQVLARGGPIRPEHLILEPVCATGYVGASGMPVGNAMPGAAPAGARASAASLVATLGASRAGTPPSVAPSVVAATGAATAAKRTSAAAPVAAPGGTGTVDPRTKAAVPDAAPGGAGTADGTGSTHPTGQPAAAGEPHSRRPDAAVPRGAPTCTSPEGTTVHPDDQGAQALVRPEAGPILPLAEFERQYLARVLAHTQGVIHGERGAARLLQVKPTTLRSRLEKLGLLQKGVRICSCS